MPDFSNDVGQYYDSVVGYIVIQNQGFHVNGLRLISWSTSAYTGVEQTLYTIFKWKKHDNLFIQAQLLWGSRAMDTLKAQ